MNTSNVKASEVKDSNLGVDVKTFNKQVLDRFFEKDRLLDMGNLADFYYGGSGRYYRQSVMARFDDGHHTIIESSVRDINDIATALRDEVDKEEYARITQILVLDYSYAPYINEDGEEEETDKEAIQYTYDTLADK